jgi:hypothetical protein
MRIWCLLAWLVLLAIAAAPLDPARAAVACRFISSQELAGAMPAAKWSFVSDQDGRGCIFQGGRGDTLMLTVFRNPTPDRARELYDMFVKTLGERMPAAPVSGIGDEAQAGITPLKAARPEASIVTLSGDAADRCRRGRIAALCARAGAAGRDISGGVDDLNPVPIGRRGCGRPACRAKIQPGYGPSA